MEFPQVRRICKLCGKEYWDNIGGFFDGIELCGTCIWMILIDTAEEEDIIYHNDCSDMIVNLENNTISNVPLSLISRIASESNNIGLKGKWLTGIRIKEGRKILNKRSYCIRFRYGKRETEFNDIITIENDKDELERMNDIKKIMDKQNCGLKKAIKIYKGRYNVNS